MISQISLSSEIFDALFKAKDIENREFEDAQAWITDIKENPDRPKLNYCEICGHSDKKLEVHHIRGKKYGNEVITVCVKCHKTLTDNQRLWDYNNPDTFFERGLIDIFELKYLKTEIEIYRLIAENLTASFKVIL